MTDTDRTATAPSNHDRLIAAAQAEVATVTLVVHPCDEPSLRGAVEAGQAKLIRPVLVGPEAKLRKVAATYDIDLTGCEIVDAPHSHAAAETAVAMIRAGRGELLMKGSLHTDELMHAVADKLTGLQT